MIQKILSTLETERIFLYLLKTFYFLKKLYQNIILTAEMSVISFKKEQDNNTHYHHFFFFF